MPKGRPISNRDQEIVDLYLEGYSVEEVAEKVGYTVGTIKNKLTEQQLYDPPLTEYFVKKIWCDWQKACETLKGEKMRINLPNDFYITRDNYNWILNKRHLIKKGKREGEYSYKVVGYYSKLKPCIIGYLDKVSSDRADGMHMDMIGYAEHCENVVKETADYIVDHISELIEKE